VVYDLFRSDAPEITTIQGLTAIESDIVPTTTLDRRPSPTDHSYAVVA
jgi:hypothetical protein